jgi:GAF domain-containing protein/HAMP domain-containing protein
VAKKPSIFQIVILSLILTSVIPLGIIAYDAATNTAVTIGQLLIGLLVVIAVIFLLVLAFSRLILQPLVQLSNGVQSIERSVDEETANPVFSTDSLKNIAGMTEITDLGQSFNKMVAALQRRVNELNSIYAMAQTITANIDFDATLQAVLTAVGQVVDSDAAEISLVEENRLIVRGWRGKENFNNTTGRVHKFGEGLTGMLAEGRVFTYLPSIDSIDLQATLGYQAMTTHRELLTKTTKLVIRSFLGLPLMAGDQLVGTLTLVHHEPNYFTETDKRQLNKLAEQASIAIGNAARVREREILLQQQIKALQIEIDESHKAQQVQEIVETDFFRDLQARADKIRARRSAGNQTQEVELQDTVELPIITDSGNPEDE